MDDILKYINEESPRGELARELQGIIADYQSGTISLEDKNDLVNAVVEGFKATKASSDEDTMRWIVSAASVVAAVV